MTASNVSTPDLRYSLIAVLARRLADVSPQFGRTALVKLLYLAQEVYALPLGYRFSFYTYGPYSPEVLEDLEKVRQRAAVDVGLVLSEPGGYLIMPGSNCDALIEAGRPLLARFDQKITSLVDSFGHFRAKDLELRTTLIYLTKNHNSVPSRREHILNLLRQLKPHFSDEEVSAAMNELVSTGIMQLPE